MENVDEVVTMLHIPGHDIELDIPVPAAPTSAPAFLNRDLKLLANRTRDSWPIGLEGQIEALSDFGAD